VISLAIWSLVFGTILGRFFKVWVLVPAMAVAGLIIVAGSAYHGSSVGQALLECVVLVTCLQIGYMSGLLSYLVPSLKSRFKQSRKSARPAATSLTATRHRPFF
jgi:hypothetical protein